VVKNEIKKRNGTEPEKSEKAIARQLVAKEVSHLSCHSQSQNSMEIKG
jgi:hypothetical protein